MIQLLQLLFFFFSSQTRPCANPIVGPNPSDLRKRSCKMIISIMFIGVHCIHYIEAECFIFKRILTMAIFSHKFESTIGVDSSLNFVFVSFSPSHYLTIIQGANGPFFRYGCSGFNLELRNVMHRCKSPT